MANQPDKDLADALTAYFSTLPAGAIRWGEPLSPTEPSASAVQMWVYATGGRSPEWYMQRAAGDGHIVGQYPVDLTVRVRALTADAYDAPLALARSVVYAAASLALSMTAYDDVTVQAAEPLYLGPNEAGQMEWNVPFLVRWTQ